MRSRNFMIKLMVLVAILAALAFWIISLTVEDAFKNFKASYVVAIIVGVLGLAMMLKAIMEKDTISKKAYMLFAVIFFVCCAIGIVPAFGIKNSDKIFLPVILAVVVVGFILSLFVTGGKKWDEGDNHQAGYKNYYERKAEEEKAKKEE